MTAIEPPDDGTRYLAAIADIIRAAASWLEAVAALVLAVLAVVAYLRGPP